MTEPTEGLDLRWVELPSEIAALADDWAGLCAATAADPYLHPAWVDAWWRSFGAGLTFRCLVARRDGQIVGVLPFALHRFWVGPLPVRVARLAGTDPHCLVLRAPVASGLLAPLLVVAVRHLLDQEGCDTVSLSPVSDLSDLQAAVRCLPPDLACREVSDGSHTVFDLPDSFETWLSALPKKRRAQFRRDMSGLAQEFGATSRVTRPDPAAFVTFAAFHDRQWQALGKGGHFTDWPGSVAFYSDLAARNDAGFLRFFDIAGPEGPLATQFAVVANDTCHWRLPARNLDARTERLSIGKVGLITMIRDLIGMGVRRVEAGRGEYDYKLAYGGRQVPVRRVLLTRSGAVAQGRLNLLLGWADAVHFLYYRAWFLKLAPRLRRWTGMPPRPLRQVWLRSRV